MNANTLNEFLKKDLYKILNITETASKEEIEQAYQNLKREYHPNSVEFQKITYAYNVLTKNRKKYNSFRAKAKQLEQSQNEEEKSDTPKTLDNKKKSSSHVQELDSKKDLLIELKNIERFITIIDNKIESLKKLIQNVNIEFERKRKSLSFQENCETNVLMIEQNRVLQQMSPFSRKFNKRRVKAIDEIYDRQIHTIREYYQMQKKALEQEWQEEQKKAKPQNEKHQREIDFYQSYRKILEQKRDQINIQLYGTFNPEFDKTAKKAV